MEGVEAAHLLRKAQVKRLDGRDAAGQARFVESLFGVAPWLKARLSLSATRLIFRNRALPLVSSSGINPPDLRVLLVYALTEFLPWTAPTSYFTP